MDCSDMHTQATATPTEQKIDRARLHCGLGINGSTQRSDLALAFNICRSRLQRLEAIERNKSTARASDSIHLLLDDDPVSVPSSPQQRRCSSRPTTTGGAPDSPPIVQTPSLGPHTAARPHQQPTAPATGTNTEPRLAETGPKKRKRADTRSGRMAREPVLPSTSPPEAESWGRDLPRHAFVTVGATASFRALLAEILRPPFLLWLQDYGFRALTVQCGPDEDWFRSMVQDLDLDPHRLEINCFGYTKNMRDYIIPCRPVDGVSNAGIVICHAGAGTVIDVSRCSVPFVVVPNEDLMNNHQAELAAYLDGEKWAVSAKPSELAGAIKRAHEQAYASGLFAVAPEEAHLDRHEEQEGISFPMPTHKRITLLDWMAHSCYPELGEYDARPANPSPSPNAASSAA